LRAFATFDPTVPLGRWTTYVARLHAGIDDLSGNALAPTSGMFRTGT
jgi:hypothetical protein